MSSSLVVSVIDDADVISLLQLHHQRFNLDSDGAGTLELTADRRQSVVRSQVAQLHLKTGRITEMLNVDLSCRNISVLKQQLQELWTLKTRLTSASQTTADIWKVIKHEPMENCSYLTQ